jgi:hypothetical protein
LKQALPSRWILPKCFPDSLLLGQLTQVDSVTRVEADEAAANAARREEAPRVAFCRECPHFLLLQDKVAEIVQLEELRARAGPRCGSVIDLLRVSIGKL